MLLLLLNLASGGEPGAAVLTGRSATSASTVTRAAIVQTRVLAGRSATSASTVTRAAIVQTRVLAGRSISQTSQMSRAAVTILRVLTARSLGQDATSSSAVVVHWHVLTSSSGAEQPLLQGGAFLIRPLICTAISIQGYAALSRGRARRRPTASSYVASPVRVSVPTASSYVASPVRVSVPTASSYVASPVRVSVPPEKIDAVVVLPSGKRTVN